MGKESQNTKDLKQEAYELKKKQDGIFYLT
jgi:hypothetical protein